MSRLVRKNLVVDPDELQAWAREHGTSESEAVRDAVRLALASQEMVGALQALHDAGAFADFGRLFPPPPVQARRRRTSQD